MSDDVNHPPHYTKHPSGVECIQVTEHHDFCIGNVIKYCWRAGLKTKGASELKDLQKARRYLDRKIARLEKVAAECPYHVPEEMLVCHCPGEQTEGTCELCHRRIAGLPEVLSEGSEEDDPPYENEQAFRVALTGERTYSTPPHNQALVCVKCRTLIPAGTTQHNCPEEPATAVCKQCRREILKENDELSEVISAYNRV